MTSLLRSFKENNGGERHLVVGWRVNDLRKNLRCKETVTEGRRFRPVIEDTQRFLLVGYGRTYFRLGDVDNRQQRKEKRKPWNPKFLGQQFLKESPVSDLVGHTCPGYQWCLPLGLSLGPVPQSSFSFHSLKNRNLCNLFNPNPILFATHEFTYNRVNRIISFSPIFHFSL